MRLVFMGTPDFAASALAEILTRGHDVAAVYTRAPKPAGRRGLETTPSPVHRLAQSRGLPVFTPASLRAPAACDQFRQHGVDVAAVVAYGLLLPPAILSAPIHGCLNLHASLLPRWRGAGPINRAVMAGDSETGVYAMRMEEGLDTGPVVDPPARVEIGDNETAGELRDRLAPLGARLLADALDRLARGELTFRPQDEAGATYARKIEKSERRIDWALPAKQVHDLIRGLSPSPSATFETDFGRGPETVKVLRARLAEGEGEPGRALDDALTIACGSGAVQLVELQRAGKERLGAGDFLRGARISAGAVLG